MKAINGNHNGHRRSVEVQEEPSSVDREGVFEPLLDSKEAAALLKIHPNTLKKLARSGEISALQIGKLWRFRASALDEWVKKMLS
jgi:excisionase family DNA binding protein